jgi:hypothetical protein
MWSAVHQQNGRKYWKTLWTHPWRPSPNNLWPHRHSWDQLWSLPGDLNRKAEHAQHAKFVSRLLTNYKTQWNVNVFLEQWDNANEDPTSIFILLCSPNWKWIWRDNILKEYLTSKGNCKWYLTALRKLTYIVLSKRGKNDRIAKYVPKETIFKDMAGKIE